MPVNTVIFDYGCVLSLAPPAGDFEPLRKMVGVDASTFQKLYWRNRDAYDLDQLDTPAYWQDVARAAGMTFSPEQIREISALDTQVWVRTNPVMLEWVRVLRERGFKTAMISNMSRAVGDYLRRTAPWLALFNPVCLSGELKIGKPGPAIYHACLEALDVPAAQTLFIDDREVNVATARALGMQPIVFSSAEQLQKDLEPYGLAESLAKAKTRAG